VFRQLEINREAAELGWAVSTAHSTRLTGRTTARSRSVRIGGDTRKPCLFTRSTRCVRYTVTPRCTRRVRRGTVISGTSISSRNPQITPADRWLAKASGPQANKAAITSRRQVLTVPAGVNTPRCSWEPQAPLEPVSDHRPSHSGAYRLHGREYTALAGRKR
jgi:hypothetical protein